MRTSSYLSNYASLYQSLHVLLGVGNCGGRRPRKFHTPYILKPSRVRASQTDDACWIIPPETKALANNPELSKAGAQEAPGLCGLKVCSGNVSDLGLWM